MHWIDPNKLADGVGTHRCPYQRAADGGALRLCVLPAPDAGDGCPHARAQTPRGTVVLVGVNHHTAPLALRERFYIGPELTDMLAGLRSAGLSEAVVLFTCNRFEVYGAVGDGGVEQVEAYLAGRCGMTRAQLATSLYRATGPDAVRHLMRVASGLESMVLGEPQILGQVAEALAYAQSAGAAGAVLNRLFTSAVRAGKRARTETSIGRHTLSISHAAVLLARSMCDLTRSRVLVVGAGEMARLALEALHANATGDVVVVNRTLARARALAESFGATPAALEDLPKRLSEADVVLAATSSPHPLIVADTIPHRPTGKTPPVIVDLGVPRNVGACVGQSGLARVFVVDDLQQVVEEHRILRQREAACVEALIEEELRRYQDWTIARQVTPLIAGLRRRADAVVDAEIEQALRRLPSADAQTQAIVGQLARRIAGKLLHAPTVALRSRLGADYARVLRQMLDIPPEANPAEQEPTR